MSKMDQRHPAYMQLGAGTKVDLTMLQKSDLIDATQWANEFSFAQVKRLAAFMDVHKIPPQTVLFYEGDKTTFMVLIVKGQVQVVKFDSQQTPKRIATLGPGKTIGEMSIIDGQPRSASAVSVLDAIVLVMTTENYHRLVDERPRVAVILIQKIAKLMSQYLRQTSGRLIDHLSH